MSYKDEYATADKGNLLAKITEDIDLMLNKKYKELKVLRNLKSIVAFWPQLNFQFRSSFSKLMSNLYTKSEEIKQKNANYFRIKNLLLFFKQQSGEKLEIIGNLNEMRDKEFFPQNNELKLEIQKSRKIIHQVTDIQIPNLPMLCCTRFFYLNSFLNRGESDRKIVCLDENSMNFQTRYIQKYINAALNEKYGAYLFFGINPDNLKVNGSFFNKEFIQEIERRVSEVKKKIYPFEEKYQLQFSAIPVFDKILEAKEEKQKYWGKENKGMYVLRIKVLPVNSNISYCIQYNRTGRNPQFQLYKFGDNFIPMKIEEQKIYTFVLEKFFSKQRKGHFNYNSRCQEPLLTKYPETLQKEQEIKKQIDFEDINGIKEDQMPTFPYSKKTIIMANTNKHDGIIQKIFSEMQEKKFKFRTCRPFKSMFEGSGRSIFFISHEDDFQQVQKVKIFFDKNKNLSLFSVNSNLEFTSSKTRQKKLQRFIKGFKEKFPNKEFKKEIRRIQEKNRDQEHTYLLFSSFEDVIYAFIYLEHEGIRTFFKKKNKIQGKLEKEKYY